MAGALAAEWRPLLGTPPSEVRLSVTLPTGQSFRWRATGSDQWTGVLGRRVVSLKQGDAGVEYLVHRDARPGEPSSSAWPASGRAAAGAAEDAAVASSDAAALRDYFTLDTSLQRLYSEFSAKDERFASIASHLPGCRIMRQDPVECLFSFICSSNNNIARIAGMVERLCTDFGDELDAGAGAPDGRYYAFPTLQQLARASEGRLREAGFGYRAKYIVDAAHTVLRKGDEGHTRIHPSPFAITAVLALLDDNKT